MTFLQGVIEAGGGIWVGIQDGAGVYPDLVLFNSRKTGSTLALKVNEVIGDVVGAPERVRRHIEASDSKFTTQRSSILSVQERIQ